MGSCCSKEKVSHENENKKKNNKKNKNNKKEKEKVSQETEFTQTGRDKGDGCSADENMFDKYGTNFNSQSFRPNQKSGSRNQPSNKKRYQNEHESPVSDQSQTRMNMQVQSQRYQQQTSEFPPVALTHYGKYPAKGAVASGYDDRLRQNRQTLPGSYRPWVQGSGFDHLSRTEPGLGQKQFQGQADIGLMGHKEYDVKCKRLQEDLHNANQTIATLGRDLQTVEREKQDIQNELTKCKETNELLNSWYNYHERTLKKKDTDITQLNNKIQQLRQREGGQQRIQRMQNELAQKDNDVKRLQHDLQNQNREAEKWYQRSRSLEKKNEDLTNKLAAEMSTKMAADESCVENVSIKNRPMNIAEEYQQLCSNQWLDAKNTIDDYSGSTQEFLKLHMLSEVMMVCERESVSTLKSINSHFEMMLFDPMVCVAGKNTSVSRGGNVPKTGKHLSKELSNNYSDMLRSAADNIDISSLVEDILDSLAEANAKFPIWHKVCQDESVMRFITDTVRLCWKMAIQRPQMQFKTCHFWQGDKFMELAWNSDQSPQAILLQVYPMLYHGESLMAKGKVLTVDPRKLSNRDHRLIQSLSQQKAITDTIVPNTVV